MVCNRSVLGWRLGARPWCVMPFAVIAFFFVISMVGCASVDQSSVTRSANVDET